MGRSWRVKADSKASHSSSCEGSADCRYPEVASFPFGVPRELCLPGSTSRCSPQEQNMNINKRQSPLPLSSHLLGTQGLWSSSLVIQISASPSTWKLGVEQAGVQGQPQLSSKFEDSLGHIRLHKKKNKQQQKPNSKYGFPPVRPGCALPAPEC